MMESWCGINERLPMRLISEKETVKVLADSRRDIGRVEPDGYCEAEDGDPASGRAMKLVLTFINGLQGGATDDGMADATLNVVPVDGGEVVDAGDNELVELLDTTELGIDVLNTAVLSAAVLGAVVLGIAVVSATVLGAVVLGIAVVGADVFGAVVFGIEVVSAAALGAVVFGTAVLGAVVLGIAVLGAAVLGAAVVGGTSIDAESEAETLAETGHVAVDWKK